MRIQFLLDILRTGTRIVHAVSGSRNSSCDDHSQNTQCSVVTAWLRSGLAGQPSRILAEPSQLNDWRLLLPQLLYACHRKQVRDSAEYHSRQCGFGTAHPNPVLVKCMSNPTSVPLCINHSPIRPLLLRLQHMLSLLFSLAP